MASELIISGTHSTRSAHVGVNIGEMVRPRSKQTDALIWPLHGTRLEIWDFVKLLKRHATSQNAT